VPIDFKGKVALVTGGTAGIGRASAVALAAAGAKLIVCGRRDSEGQETLRLIREAGGEGEFVRADVSRREDVEALIRATAARFGRLDIAFNNAGVEGGLGLFADLEEKDYERVFDVNVRGLWLCMKYELEQMLKKGGGSIVNTASIAGLTGAPKMAAYSGSKHAVIGLTKSAAVEYAAQNIRINAVCPGFIETDMYANIPDKTKEAILKRIPLGRTGTPQEIARCVRYLIVDGDYITGQTLNINGGIYMQ